MSNTAIHVNDVSKAYLIGLREAQHETFGGAVLSWLKSPMKNYNILKRLNTFEHNEDSEDLFWALRNISFEIKHGDTLGIIGDNGAGKSTLLKIISRITNPTKGYADVNGRVSSLLEVGTGFHNELTGRENVYLNGTLLGMSKKEIAKKFDEIVHFSGVEKFIDTQIKKYSTGMRIRLAFAVAASIETEIIIIDEVLSVGDAEFRKKSVAKMEEIAKRGVAIILVTHNMHPIQTLCKRTIHLKHGRIMMDGKTDEVVANYLGNISKDKTRQQWELDSAPGSDTIKLTGARVYPLEGSLPAIKAGDAFGFEFEFFNMLEDDYDVTVMFHLSDELENLVFIGSTQLTNKKFRISKGYVRATCRVPQHLLNSGKFTVSKFYVLRGTDKLLYEHTDLLTFEITSTLAYAHGYNGKIEGLLKPLLDWNVKVEEEAEVSS